jgi:hypothetical protein
MRGDESQMKLLSKTRDAFPTLATDPRAARTPYPCAARTRFKVFDSLFDSLEIREGVTPRKKPSGLPSLTQINFSKKRQQPTLWTRES